MASNKILVAPLNWGLGHATRCVPIINALQEEGYEPIIGSDGQALELLKKEFPELEAVELPAYNIKYAKKAWLMPLRYLLLLPGIIKAINEERNFLKRLIKTHQLHGVISDNRLGLYNSDISSVIITHQLRVFSGLTTCFSTWLHRRYIAKYDYCWVPDVDNVQSLAGKLSKSKFLNQKIRYIGPLSRLKKRFPSEVKYAYLVLLSGPEPQRTLLEDILMAEMLRVEVDQKILFVRGVIEETQKFHKVKNIKVYNYLSSEGLEKAISQSNVVISRSGYTTIMDLSKLNKKAFFIPTPGQYEQEYLADFLTKTGRVPSCTQDKFKMELLSKVEDYSGLDDSVFSVSEFEAVFAEAFSNVNENSEPLPSSLST